MYIGTYNYLLFLDSSWTLEECHFLYPIQKLSPFTSYSGPELRFSWWWRGSPCLLNVRTQNTRTCFGLPLIWPLEIEEVYKLSYHVKIVVREEVSLPFLTDGTSRDLFDVPNLYLNFPISSPTASPVEPETLGTRRVLVTPFKVRCNPTVEVCHSLNS